MAILSLEPTTNTIDDPVGGFAISVWIFQMCHRFIRGVILEQSSDFGFDQTGIGADQSDRAGVDSLRALGGLTHHEHRLAETRCLFLHATGIGEQKT